MGEVESIAVTEGVMRMVDGMANAFAHLPAEIMLLHERIDAVQDSLDALNNWADLDVTNIHGPGLGNEIQTDS